MGGSATIRWVAVLGLGAGVGATGIGTAGEWVDPLGVDALELDAPPSSPVPLPPVPLQPVPVQPALLPPAGRLVLPAANSVPTAAADRGLAIQDVIRATLAGNPDIRLQEQRLERAAGELETATGAFDTTLTVTAARAWDEASDPFSSGASTTTTSFASYRAGLRKTLRTGTTLTPSVEMLHTHVSDDPAATNQARVRFTIGQPLLRGRGRAATAAEERAAELEHEAARFDLEHVVAGRVLATIDGYWSLLAATRTLEVLRASEERARRLMSDTRILIDADERPRADLQQLLTFVADKVDARIRAEQDLYEARQTLGLAIGAALADIDGLGRPSSTFPAALAGPELASGPWLLESALDRRADLAAARRRLAAERVRLGRARNDLRPVLDLEMEVGYAGQEDGSSLVRYFSPLTTNVAGLNWSTFLLYEWPFANHARSGVQRSQEATLQAAAIATDELARTLGSRVAVARSNLTHSAASVENSARAIGFAEAAARDEEEKVRVGLSTIIDLILTQDRLTSAEQRLIADQRRHASAIARLRFETATLWTIDAADRELAIEELLRPPAPLASPQPASPQPAPAEPEGSAP